jgi:hypothetical protein
MGKGQEKWWKEDRTIDCLKLSMKVIGVNRVCWI